VAHQHDRKLELEFLRKSQNATEWRSHYVKLPLANVIFSFKDIGKLQSCVRFGSHWLELHSFSEAGSLTNTMSFGVPESNRRQSQKL
jgi:hypothetical protein